MIAAAKARVAQATRAEARPARPRVGKGKWMRVEDLATTMTPPAQETPAVRGHYVERTVVEADPAREVTSYEGYERVLYEGDVAAIDRPDEKPDHRPVSPRQQFIKVPRRAEVVTGAGERPPRAARWGLPRRSDG